MGSRSIRWTSASVAVLLSAVALPAALRAQAVVRGILYDDANGSPIKGTVMLVDPSTDAAVVHASADSLGQFDLKVGPGMYQIGAVRPGYTSVLSAPIQLQNGERLTIRLPIAENGDPQHRIGVIEHIRPDAKAVHAAQVMHQTSEMDGFNSRKAMGTGLHYTRIDFEKSNVTTLGQFLQTVPGFTVRDPTTTSSMQASRNAYMTSIGAGASGGLGTCRLGWFMDGHRMDIPGQTDPVTDGLGLIPLDNLEAVEVFRGISEMPAQFADPDLRCGAVAIWTRHGS